ncbi:citrate synthase [Helicobacter pylori]|uniref:citrate synthase n=1 Tax=Helicobacter pylori TaxID=210 RepID=UPI0009A327A6|nr:citrate synthase [Helicobacter pylori]MBH0256817.1 citrate synthase [Helicobacter pylori]NHB14069.1 citrate synthase [Helicobacter pylori]OPG18642.1 citrate (Si)-synthase [Helicobacter pylori]OPG44841.1 citrate (Si)-synthase [Helicobacter pylori]QEF38055.1 citrate synthase [Helicobacter pylori]
MSVTLINNENNERYEFEMIECTRGPKAVDFSKLFETTGFFSYDPGYSSTAGCQSKISYVNGKQGELYYRGHRIEDLVAKYKYVDVCKLLLTGELPKNQDESLEFELELRHRSFIHESLLNMFSAFPSNAHPMAKLSSGVSILSTLYSTHQNMHTEEDYQTMARRIVAKIPTLAAICYRNEVGAPIIYPDIARSYVENILFMLRGYPYSRLKHTTQGEVEITPLEIEAFDKILTLHADHSQNASSTTVRNVASTGVHPYAAISAGISALWGHLHGGANEKVLIQLEEIGDVKNVDKYIARVKDKNDSFKLMGFGHRVYKSYDPRAKILKGLKDELHQKGVKMDERLSEIAAKVEEIALKDEYFIERNLYPNVDFYSGTILRALKIPVRFFTPVFVIGRTVGWCAQLLEHVKSPQARITRPRQVYVGD